MLKSNYLRQREKETESDRMRGVGERVWQGEGPPQM